MADTFPDALVEHLAKFHNKSEDEIKTCLLQTQVKTQAPSDFIALSLWDISQKLNDREISVLVERVDDMFTLNDHEKDTLKSYLQFMHKERRDKFVSELHQRDKTYISEFLDTELEEFGDETFSVSYEDFVDPNQPTKRLIMYNDFVATLKTFSKVQREQIYKTLGVRFDQTEDKRQRRVNLYSAFVNHLGDQTNFQKWDDVLNTSI